MRIRDLGYTPGMLPCGPKNSILDIEGLFLFSIGTPGSVARMKNHVLLSTSNEILTHNF